MTTMAMHNRFVYQARDSRGQISNGFISATTLAEATKSLRNEGKYIIDVRPATMLDKAVNASSASGPVIAEVRRVAVTNRTTIKSDELIHITMQLSVMVDTGVPLSDALQSLAEQSFSEPCVAILKSIVNDVTGGKDFSASLEKFPRVFPRYYISLVRAAEVSGMLGTMMRKLADYLVSQRETTKKVKGALIYPAFMMIMCLSSTLFLLTCVLPKFTSIFASRKAALPLPTQILMVVSHSLIHFWYCWAIGGFAIFAGITLLLKTRSGQRMLDWGKLRVPILGPMFHKLFLSRALSTMGTMITSGVQLLDCLSIVKEVAGNCYYEQLWDEVRLRVQNGSQLSEPLLKSTLIPRSVSQMIHSGEKTGELPAVLTRLSSYMEEDLRTAIKTATQFIEPVMIAVMGAIIGGVAIAMLMPILTISRVMAQ